MYEVTVSMFFPHAWFFSPFRAFQHWYIQWKWVKLDTKGVSERYELLQTLNKNITDSSLMSFSTDNSMKSDRVDLKSESILKSFNGGVDKYLEYSWRFLMPGCHSGQARGGCYRLTTSWWNEMQHYIILFSTMFIKVTENKQIATRRHLFSVFFPHS